MAVEDSSTAAEKKKVQHPRKAKDLSESEVRRLADEHPGLVPRLDQAQLLPSAHTMVMHPMVEEILRAQQALSEEDRRSLASYKLRSLTLQGEEALYLNSCLYIPVNDDTVELRKKLLTSLHVAVLHAGESSALRRLKGSHLFMPDFKKQYHAIRSTCITCITSVAATGSAPEKAGGVIPPPWVPPFEMLHMDAAKYTPSLDGYVGFFVICCTTSRWLRIVPYKALNSASAAEALESWLKDYDMPQWIVTDGGSENKLELEKICKHYKIHHHIGTPHNHSPRTSENFIGRIKEALSRSIPSGKIQLWPSYLPYIEHALSLLPIDSLGGISPREYIYGPRSKALRVDEDGAQPRFPVNHDQYKEVLEATRAFADYASEIAKFDRAASYNASHPITHFEKGDWVLMYDPSHTRQISTTYSSPFDGPFIVKEVETVALGSGKGTPTGYYTLELLLSGSTAEAVRSDPKVTKHVHHARCLPYPKGDGSTSASHSSRLHPGSHLVQEVIMGPLTMHGIPYLFVRYFGIENPLLIPFSAFADKQVKGKGPVTTNVVILTHLAKVGYDASGEPLSASTSRPNQRR